MATRKRRVVQHIMEDKSYQLIKNTIPEHWVIREFNRPDYGIDLVIELFDKINDTVSETLGEFIYVQVKSVDKLKTKKEKVYPVGNVSKGNWVENKSEHIEIDVAKFSIDTDSIYTVQTLGASISILLLLVDLNENEIYFICLNDYIDKVLLPQKPQYINQKTITLNIPLKNTFKNVVIAEAAMKFYGKRAKFLASFSKFAYQKNELSYVFSNKTFPIHTYRDELKELNSLDSERIKELVIFFICQIETLDIWDFTNWSILSNMKTKIETLKLQLIQDESEWQFLRDEIIVLWHQLTNLGTIYEEICREWFLPKHISFLLSYDD